jgi:transcriptional regulator with XRE-family HTH domain
MKSNQEISPLLSLSEVCETLGARTRVRRKSLKLSRRELSEKSGVSVPTIGRFETKGVATLSVVVKIAFALQAVDTLNSVFIAPKSKSIEEYLREDR